MAKKTKAVEPVEEPAKKTKAANGKIAKKFATVLVPIGSLKPHSRNYRQHPEDQLDHIEASIREHGFYRNVVVARDGTILAGHGVVLAMTRMGATEVPVVRVNVAPDDPRALKILAGDNEIRGMAEVDDRALTEILKSIAQQGKEALLGTGFDQAMLASLAMISRPASEIANINEAAEWVGMPAYEDGAPSPKITITFKTTEDRDRFVKMAKLTIDKVAGLSWSTRWPFTEREDAASVRFEAAE